MKALTLWQPWASLIAVGAKRIETRGWSTSYRGPLAIHAASRRAEELGLPQLFAKYGLDPKALPLGAVVAVAQLVDVRRTELLEPRPIEYALGDFGPRRYGWLLEDVRVLRRPFVSSGARGLWDVELPASLVLEALTPTEIAALAGRQARLQV